MKPGRHLLPALVAGGLLVAVRADGPAAVPKVPADARGPAVLPPVPVVKSPTTRFRELLAAAPSEREALLAGKSPASRALIEAKLREFSALRPDEREIRLRLAQLQDTLRPLLAVPPAERADLLAAAPPEDRPLVEERLAAWDALPAEARRDVLDSERRLSWFIRSPESDATHLARYVDALPPAAKAAATDQLGRWLALPEAERTRKAAAFSRFFDLTPAERTAALRTLSEPELRQMERTLSDFARLGPAEREGCVRGFRSFEALSPRERAEFLRKAERWQAMSPDDRAAWRRLVQRALHPPVEPPLPARDTLLAVTNR